jgi:hypothetical protein
MPMATEVRNIKLREGMGTTAYEIAGYLIREEYGVGDLRTMPEQFRCRVAEWLVEQNRNNYRFVVDRTMNIPGDEVELIRIGIEGWRAGNGTTGSTSGPKGWMLTTTGRLVRGRTGWLVDENGLYILQDGRRLNNREGELGIGDQDRWVGLESILGIDRRIARASEYNTSTLFNNYGTSMSDVVYQAFQINICYKKTNAYAETKINNDSRKVFYSIGRDESNIPIVATRIGPDTAENKLVIAGPHGNERMARFVVLETQKHFIQNGISDPNLALYFIPAMSPTLFFADARGLPFVKNGNEYESFKNPEDRRGAVADICNFLSIPKLHDFMATNVDSALMHDNIQSNNGTPENPIYGIDTNRDLHNLLESTRAFMSFINRQVRNNPLINSMPGISQIEVPSGISISPTTGSRNITVIMLHGHEDAFRPVRERIFNHAAYTTEKGYDDLSEIGMGTVLGPYEVDSNERGSVVDPVMGYVNYMTAALFGYIYGGAVADYLYGRDRNVRNLKGEWGRKLYSDEKDINKKILCFDIELANSHRDGTRGKTERGQTALTNMGYDPNEVVKRDEKFQFFKKENGAISGKFANVSGKVAYKTADGENKYLRFTIPFYEFLISYFDDRGIPIDREKFEVLHK